MLAWIPRERRDQDDSRSGLPAFAGRHVVTVTVELFLLQETFKRSVNSSRPYGQTTCGMKRSPAGSKTIPSIDAVIAFSSHCLGAIVNVENN